MIIQNRARRDVLSKVEPSVTSNNILIFFTQAMLFTLPLCVPTLDSWFVNIALVIRLP